MLSKIGYYLIVFPLSFLPMWILYRFSDIFYLLLITVFPYRKKVIEKNLSNSFPELNYSSIKHIRNKFYRHFADILIEGVANLSLSKKNLTKRVKVINTQVMTELYSKNKSVVLVGAHYNNWEWIISSMNFLFPHKAFGIGMPMTNKFWDHKVNSRRERFGMKVIHSKNFKQEIENNKDCIAILTLSDQSPGDANKSYWTKFLNQETAVLFGAEMMAHQFDFAVVYFHQRKIRRGYYQLELELITESPKKCQWGEITQKHVHLLEKEIVTNPEFWLWSHKRWKRNVPENLEILKKQQNESFNKKFNY